MGKLSPNKAFCKQFTVQRASEYMNIRVSECTNEKLNEWQCFCQPPVHTRIEFPREHVFNFHARIILNGGKTVERDNKTKKEKQKKKKTLATKTILLFVFLQPAAAAAASGHAVALTMWPPALFHCPSPPGSGHRWAAVVALHFLAAVVYFRKVIPNWLSDWPAA